MTHFPPATLGAALVPVGRTRSRLARWKRKLATSPATAKIAIVGDSTAEETNYPWPYSRLRTYWMQPGMALGGMQSANLIEGGNSGLSLQNWLGGSAVDFTPAALWAAAPDLAIFRFLTNDTRLGTRTQAQMTADVQTLIDLTTANLPGADIVLTVPPTFTTTVVGQDFLGGATLAQAQARADAMRAALLGFTDAYPHVLVLDSGGDVYGTRVGATSPLMTDQLHPNQTGQERWADYVAPIIGLDRARPVDAPDSYRWQIVGRVSSGGNGFIDLDTLDASGVRGKEWPLTASDLLYIPGFAAYPLTLTGATFAASGNNVRVLKGGTDFTGVAANTMVVAVGNHPREGVTGGRTEVTIDPGSIAASSTLDVTATVTGAATQMGVVAQPPTSVSAGLMWQAWVTATDTVTLRFFNPTAGAIDPPSGVWKFWLAR
jgi:lysophospholipase L1-like esterase